MKFFIMGSSWGVGEYFYNGQILESVPNTGIDYHLRKLGHTVTNVSAGSAANFGQLRHAYWTLIENKDYDYIIWFITDSLRDIIETCIEDPDEQQIQFPQFEMSLNFKKVLKYIDEQNYQYAQKLYDQYQIPFVIVEGPSALNKDVDSSGFVKHSIPWMQELLELDFPIDTPGSFFSWSIIQTILKHYNITEKDFITQNLDELDCSEIIINLTKASKLFPDNMHPSSICFKQLAYQIQELVR
jgi:hypothetical protein